MKKSLRAITGRTSKRTNTETSKDYDHHNALITYLHNDHIGRFFVFGEEELLRYILAGKAKKDDVYIVK